MICTTVISESRRILAVATLLLSATTILYYYLLLLYYLYLLDAPLLYYYCYCCTTLYCCCTPMSYFDFLWHICFVWCLLLWALLLYYLLLLLFSILLAATTSCYYTLLLHPTATTILYLLLHSTIWFWLHLCGIYMQWWTFKTRAEAVTLSWWPKDLALWGRILKLSWWLLFGICNDDSFHTSKLRQWHMQWCEPFYAEAVVMMIECPR